MKDMPAKAYPIELVLTVNGQRYLLNVTHNILLVNCKVVVCLLKFSIIIGPPKYEASFDNLVIQIADTGYKVTGSFSVHDDKKCDVEELWGKFGYKVRYIWGFGKNNLTLFDTQEIVIDSCYAATNYTATFNVNVETNDFNNVYFNVRGRGANATQDLEIFYYSI